MQLLDPKMFPEDLQLMSRWIVKQRRAVLDPFIKVALCGSAALHNLRDCAVGSLLANQTNPFQLLRVSARFSIYERCCVCDALLMLYLLTQFVGYCLFLERTRAKYCGTDLGGRKWPASAPAGEGAGAVS